MEKAKGKINILQVIMIMMLFNGLMSHVIVNPLLLDASGRDAWIAVLVAAALYLPWCAMIVFIMRKSGSQPIRVWLTERTNRWIAWLFVIPFLLQLYFIGASTVVQTSMFIVTNYLPATPQPVLALVLVAVCYFISLSGIRTIALGAGILLPLVVILGYFVSFSNMPEKDYGLLRPFLENGWRPVAGGVVYVGGALVETFLLLFIQHRLKSPMKVWHIIVLGSILVYITLGPLIGAISEFGPQEAAKQMVSPYEQWRLVKLGTYVEHLDFFSVYQWLSGATVRIGFAQYLLAELLPFRSMKKRHLCIGIVSLSFIVLVYVTRNHSANFLSLYEYYFPVALYVTLAVSIIWAGLPLFVRPVKGRRT